MNKLTCFLFSIVISSFGWAQASEPVGNKKYVEIEWEKVRGAVRYDLDLLEFSTGKSIKIFSSKSNIFKLNVRMGKYKFRSRIFDKYDTPSEWSPVDEMLIAPPPVTLLNQKGVPHEPIFAAKNKSLAPIEFSWNPVDGIKNYKLLIQSSDQQIKKEIDLNQTKYKTVLPAGEFTYQIVTVLPDGNMGPSSEISDAYTIIGAKVDPPKIVVKKEKGKSKFSVRTNLKNAEVFGVLEYSKLGSDQWAVVQNLEGLRKGEELALDNNDPGLYRLSLQSRAKGFVDSEKFISEYLVKPIEPEYIEIPIAISNGFGFEIEGTKEAKLALENLSKIQDNNRMPAGDSKQTNP